MFCVSLSSLSLPRLQAAAAKADMAEIRIDLWRPASDELAEVLATHGNKIIATCRAGYYDDGARIELLKTAIDAGCGYVDLETDASCAFLDALIPYAKAKGCRVILSYHNFEATPAAAALELTILEAMACGANLVKIAAMVHAPQDAARLLALYARHTAIVAFGMGEKGKFTRLAALKLGAPFMYVSPDGATPTAPGQFSESEMRALWQRL
jgi:3-dehydroquinate dehydratase type I